MSELFLTPKEVAELTGYKLAVKQAKWLRDNRWVYEVGADGRPKILRAHVMDRMGGKVDRPDDEPRLRLPEGK